MIPPYIFQFNICSSEVALRPARLVLGWEARHISLMNFIIQQSRSFEGVCVPLRLTSCLFPVPDSQPTATELFQLLLFGSGTVFRSTSHPRRHFPSSALA